MDAAPVVERTCDNLLATIDGSGSGTHTETLVLRVDCGTFTNVGHVLMSMYDADGHVNFRQFDLVCNNNILNYPVTWPVTTERGYLMVGSDFEIYCSHAFVSSP